MFMDLPGGPVVKNPPPNAQYTGSVSSSAEPMSHNCWARAPQQEKTRQWEACVQLESSPHSTHSSGDPVQPNRSVHNQSWNLVLCKGQLHRRISD